MEDLKTCPQCGLAVPLPDRRCRCGYRFGGSFPPAGPGPSGGPMTARKPASVGRLLIVILNLGIIAFILLGTPGGRQFWKQLKEGMRSGRAPEAERADPAILAKSWKRYPVGNDGLTLELPAKPRRLSSGDIRRLYHVSDKDGLEVYQCKVPGVEIEVMTFPNRKEPPGKMVRQMADGLRTGLRKAGVSGMEWEERTGSLQGLDNLLVSARFRYKGRDRRITALSAASTARVWRVMGSWQAGDAAAGKISARSLASVELGLRLPEHPAQGAAE